METDCCKYLGDLVRGDEVVITLEFQGIDEAIEALTLDLEKQLGEVIDERLEAGTAFARIHTPVDTGAMRGAWHWHRSGLEGMMTIDPMAVNPRSGASVTSYAPSVDDRLGIVEGAYQRIITMPIEEVGFGN